MLERYFLKIIALALLWMFFPAGDRAQTPGPRPLIHEAIDESKLVTLAGNTRREAVRGNDLGPVEPDLHLDMYLQLKRSPEQEEAARKFVESLSDKSSPNFHQWIAPAEFGRRFGAAPEDIAAISRWLQSHGFRINTVHSNRMVIDFSGTAGQVRAAFGTEIHYLKDSGPKRRFANMTDPRMPAALLPAVTGVVSLNNFPPRSMMQPLSNYTVGNTRMAIVPGDLATIYNLNPAFAGGFTGAGQTIVLVEDSDLYNGTKDWNTFRTTFGLDRYTHGSLTQVHPAAGNGGTCYAPGVNGAASEAALDVQWASAAAPDAAIVMASCADTTNFGGFIALQNMLTNGGPLPSVVSISYGESETDAGTTFNAYINTLYQTAAAAGVSVFVSSGDEAAAETDHRAPVSVHGVSVSSFASTPYNVAVGGTDFGDTAAGNPAAYWKGSNNLYYDSAASYVPEIPWNNSCAGSVLGKYRGYSSPAAFCNNTYLDLDSVGGSGGPSGCVTGTPALNGVVGGSCAGYPKPSWQSIPGNPNDGVRDLPDVSLFAASGLWGHYYVFCYGCSGDPSTWPGAGGTSFAAPIMAGIQALINQALGVTNAGNPNPVYYAIGAKQYSTASGAAACDSSAGPAGTCVFNDVTQGDIAVPCAGQFDCYLSGPGLGVLSTSTTSYQPAFAAAPGWDFATGIGTVNAYNLLNAYVDSVTPPAAPAAPVLVSPANQAANVLTAPELTWSASQGATSYDVYFGTSSTPPLVGNTTNLDYAPGTLSPGATYYWAIGAKNSLGANVSAPWSFTTSCVAGLSPASAGAPAAGGSFSITVTATDGCSWTAVSNVPWVTITAGASGSGKGTVNYTVAPSPAGTSRTGAIVVAGQTFTVTQGGVIPLISTLAGGAMPATPAPGTSLSIPITYGIAVDAAGNTYFPSANLNAVFKVDANGIVTRIAGTGVAGRAGDGGPALSAQLNYPNGIAADPQGNVYIADTLNGRIRKVDPSGIISTVAGSGSFGYSGDGGLAISAAFETPYGVAVDANGNLYIADTLNNRIRKVDNSGKISTIAGNGSPGYSGDGAATEVKLFEPSGVAVDNAGNVYIADTLNDRVRKVDTSGQLTTVAGSGTCCYLTAAEGGPAVNARLGFPFGVAVDGAGNLYIADENNQSIFKVTPDGTIHTAVGDGGIGFSGDGNLPTKSSLNYPYGVAVDGSGNLYIAENGTNRIRKATNVALTTLVGGALNDGGPAALGWLSAPWGVVRDNAGNTYIADTNNNRIRKVAADGTITTVAGTGLAGYAGDGAAATNALLFTPHGIALDGNGNLYIADTSNHVVRKVDPSGTITTFAGNARCCQVSGDGFPATVAGIGEPYALALDSNGNLYISDILNHVVRKVDTSGTITTVAGTGALIGGYSGDGGPATSAKLNAPYGLAADSAGNLYIADHYNNRIRKVDSSGIISTVAGTGSCCYSGDGGPATKALLGEPSGVALDAQGNLLIADNFSYRVRRVSADGTITSIAGSGLPGYTGDGGPANAATFRLPVAIAVDAAGNMVVADQTNNAVRVIVPTYTAPLLSLQSTHTGTFAPGQSGATYTLTVSNAAGAGTTSGAVTVAENLPAGLQLVSMTGSGWTCSAAACTRSDALAGGASYPAITVKVNVSASAAGQVTNQAAVSGGGAMPAATVDLTIVQ
ncbi:MAG TPA: protease pro-enzyme activation domain-containing protein [Bryobacteraceae bacterium]|nr:protease pro-enzyme activation domain-containing protein [Bryobacteraceae bacterium]